MAYTETIKAADRPILSTLDPAQQRRGGTRRQGGPLRLGWAGRSPCVVEGHLLLSTGALVSFPGTSRPNPFRCTRLYGAALGIGSSMLGLRFGLGRQEDGFPRGLDRGGHLLHPSVSTLRSCSKRRPPAGGPGTVRRGVRGRGLHRVPRAGVGVNRTVAKLASELAPVFRGEGVAWCVEWRGGISPPRSPRTVRERLRSHGSYHPTVHGTAPNCQWANNAGCFRAMARSQRVARRWSRYRLYFF